MGEKGGRLPGGNLSEKKALQLFRAGMTVVQRSYSHWNLPKKTHVELLSHSLRQCGTYWKPAHP
jgi:hypothetical protein